MRQPLSIRWRLTLWYGAVLSAILAGFSGSVYLLMRHHLLALTDAGLRGEFTEFVDEVRRAGDRSELAPGPAIAVLPRRGPRVRAQHPGG